MEFACRQIEAPSPPPYRQLAHIRQRPPDWQLARPGWLQSGGGGKFCFYRCPVTVHPAPGSFHRTPSFVVLPTTSWTSWGGRRALRRSWALPPLLFQQRVVPAQFAEHEKKRGDEEGGEGHAHGEADEEGFGIRWRTRRRGLGRW